MVGASGILMGHAHPPEARAVRCPGRRRPPLPGPVSASRCAVGPRVANRCGIRKVRAATAAPSEALALFLGFCGLFYCTETFSFLYSGISGTSLALFARSQPVFYTPRWALNPAPGSETFGTWFSASEAHHHADTEALTSMPATSKGSAGGVFL